MLDQNDYQWLFRKAPAMTTFIAEDGVYLDVNDAFLSRLGYTRDEMVGSRPEDFVTPQSARRIADEYRPVLRRTGKLENKPLSFVTRSGDVVDCNTNAIVEYRESGAFMRTIAMHSEVTDEARVNFKYRDLYRSTPAMLHTVDGDGHIVTVTDHWLQKLGYTVLVAADARAGLDILRSEEKIDLLFTDIVMPGGMNGRELGEAAERVRPGLAVLYMSGYTETTMIRSGRLEPGVLLLRKPFRRDELAQHIREALRRRGREE